jgi:hypothetical protein
MKTWELGDNVYTPTGRPAVVAGFVSGRVLLQYADGEGDSVTLDAELLRRRRYVRHAGTRAQQLSESARDGR